MKTLIALILAVALPAASLQAQQPRPTPKPDTIVEVGLFLVVASVGIYVIVKVSSKLPTAYPPGTLSLDRSYDQKQWTPIYTNTSYISITSDKLPGGVEVFREIMDTQTNAFYRARKL